ncbi:MAG: hypothetical protein ACR2KC_03515 [Acidimicrobiales bacterium]
MSELTTSVALDYLDRLARPLRALTPAAGVRVTTRGYLAHVAVEATPAAYGVDAGRGLSILGTLPALNRHGQAPRDLATRVVKATRRNFAAIRALPEPVWDGFVEAVVHEEEAREVGFDSAVVEGLLRFGWVLRQVDLHYGLTPEL